MTITQQQRNPERRTSMNDHGSEVTVRASDTALDVDLPVASMLAVIARAAADPTVDVAKMGALLQLQEHLMDRAAKVAFERDFAAAASAMPRIEKRGVIKMGEKGSIPFAKYEDLDKIVRKVEERYGFTRSFRSRPVPNGVVMICKLAHSAGHSEESEMQLPPDPGPGRNALQAMGSSRSYGCRYLTIGMWNLVTVGADDDAQSTDLVTEEQAQAIDYLMAQAGLLLGTPESRDSLRRFQEFAGAKRVADIKASRYEEVVKKLKLKAGQR